MYCLRGWLVWDGGRMRLYKVDMLKMGVHMDTLREMKPDGRDGTRPYWYPESVTPDMITAFEYDPWLPYDNALAQWGAMDRKRAWIRHWPEMERCLQKFGRRKYYHRELMGVILRGRGAGQWRL